jgi:hypothetical protein
VPFDPTSGKIEFRNGLLSGLTETWQVSRREDIPNAIAHGIPNHGAAETALFRQR